MKGIELFSETAACPSCGGQKHRVVQFKGISPLRTIACPIVYQGECRTCHMRGPVRDCVDQALTAWLLLAKSFEETPAKAPAKVKTRVIYPAICKHAEILGVSRYHLYYVLRGDRKSPRIEAYLAKHDLWRAS